MQSDQTMNTERTRYIIKFLKDEIATAHKKSKNKSVKDAIDVSFCKNELTGNYYSFMKGSHQEQNLFRVIPFDGKEKIYFDSQNEYIFWSKTHKNYLYILTCE